jgi:Leucine-rich repeat (LRR) protein/pimeloyl-ACP methyl ester carboxylesterase
MIRSLLILALVHILAANTFGQCYSTEYDLNDLQALRDLDALSVNKRWTGGNPLNWTGVTWQLYGSGPKCTYRVVELRVDRKLNGCIPETIGNLSQLRSLLLVSTEVSGALPASLGNLTNLKQLSITNSKLDGVIPASFENLKNLEELNLLQNQLSGEIPPLIYKLINLKHLSLYKNSFNGELSSDIRNLTNLEILNLGDNQLAGKIPEAIGNLRKLIYLNMGSNSFSGKLPETLTQLTTLKQLYLFDNELEGALPDFINSNRGLERIGLWGNKLTAIMLDSIEHLQNLIQLDIQDNKIKAKFPLGIRKLKDKLSVYAQNNNFSFSDLEPFADNAFPENNIHFLPQNEIGEESIVTIKIGDRLKFDAGDPCVGNVYYWRNAQRKSSGSFIVSENVTNIDINSTDAALRYSGTYTCEISNQRFTGYGRIKTKKMDVFTYGAALAAPDESVLSYYGKIEEDPNLIVKLPNIIGTSTDGVSQILLIKPSDSSPVIFRLSGDEQGSLSSLDGSQKGLKEIIVGPFSIYDPRTYLAIAIYTPPDGYGIYPTGGRDITLKSYPADNPNLVEDITIRLMPPPVVLVHGMWSDATTWKKGGFQNFLKQRGFVVRDNQLADYSWNSHLTFDPRQNESRSGRNSVRLAINDALKYYKDSLKIAAVQADVVAHSLGGLMARSFTGEHNYKNKLNYLEGSIHRLITIGTPHNGSPYGPFLWNLQVKGLTNSLVKSKPIGTVHRDFAPASNAFFRLNVDQNNETKIHTITTSYVPDITHPATYFEKFFESIYRRSYNNTVFGGQENDGMVSVSSQRAEVEDRATSLYRQINHLQQTSSPIIQQRVSELLFTNIPSLFTTLREMGSQNNSGGRVTVDDVNYVPGNNTNVSQQSVTIKNPVSLSLVEDLVPLTLKFESTGSPRINSATFIFGEDDVIEVPDGSQQITWTPPNSRSYEHADLTLIAATKEGWILADGITVQRNTPAANFVDFSYFPASMRLDAMNPKQMVWISAKAHVNNEIVTVSKLNHASSGIQFRSHYGKFNVDQQGIVTAMVEGNDTLTFKLGTFEASIPVTIEQLECADHAVLSAVTGEANPCPGVDLTYSVNASDKNEPIWSVTGLGTLPTQGKKVIINWTEPGIYNLIVKTVNECVMPLQSELVVQVQDAVFTLKPEITFNDGLLVSSYKTGNQWYRNDVIIPGANGQTLQPSDPGSYAVKVITDCGESPISNNYEFLVTGIENHIFDDIKLYPNPVDMNGFYIHTTGQSITNLTLIDLYGHEIMGIGQLTENTFVDVRNLPNGTYVLYGLSGRKPITKKIVIIR